VGRDRVGWWGGWGSRRVGWLIFGGVGGGAGDGGGGMGDWWFGWFVGGGGMMGGRGEETGLGIEGGSWRGFGPGGVVDA